MRLVWLLVATGICLWCAQRMTLMECMAWADKRIIHRPARSRNFSKQFVTLFVETSAGGPSRRVPVRVEYPSRRQEDNRRALLVYVHGPAGDLLSSNPFARALADKTGFDVLTYDDVTASSADDSARCLDAVLRTMHAVGTPYEPDTTIVWGVQTGACTVATVLGTVDACVRLVVLQDPYYSYDSYYLSMLPLWMHQFVEAPARSTLNQVAAMRCPVLVLQGRNTHKRETEIQDIFNAVASTRRAKVCLETQEGDVEWPADVHEHLLAPLKD